MKNSILKANFERYPIRGTFTISRGSKTCAQVVHCSLERNGQTGHGECVPYARYGETLDSVKAEIEAITPLFHNNIAHTDIIATMKAGAARNAVDCALWDLKAKSENTTVAKILDLSPHPLVTAYTLSLGSPEAMYQQAQDHSGRPLLKIKVGSSEEGLDIARMKAVRAGAPKAIIIADANEGWTENNLLSHLEAAFQLNIALIEQPLPTSNDAYLARIPHKVPICADESIHITSDLGRLHGLYDAVNIKLDKTGGLTEALHLKKSAQQAGFKIMVGCMVASSLSMAPAVLLAQDADFIDLDGPLLLAQDREPALVYENSWVFPPEPRLWG